MSGLITGGLYSGPASSGGGGGTVYVPVACPSFRLRQGITQGQGETDGVVEVDPNLIDWTPAGMRYLRAPPIVAGDDYLIRVQFLDDDGDAINLTGAVITMTVAGTTPFTRVSNVAIAGLSPAANQMDVDTQGVEDTVLFTGNGWVTIRFSRVAADRAALLAMVGADKALDILAVWGGTTRQSKARGKIAFLAPITA